MTQHSEHTALLDPSVRPPAQIGDAAGPPPPSNSRFGLDAFLSDIRDHQNGTIPISIVIATVIGIACGISAFMYYKILQLMFELTWDTIPKNYFAPFVPEQLHWLWIPFIVMTFALGVGLSIKFMGDPGDLKYTVQCVHEKAYISLDHAPPMVVASLVSIVGAGSLGPEAPLVAICASVGGWVSRRLFRQRYKNIVRRHTLCGMACATAAFFGVPLGGALFALEVNNRLGYEYFEHALIAIFSGTVCLVVFRWLAGLEIGPVWQLTQSARKASGGKSIGHLLSIARTAASHSVDQIPMHGPMSNASEIVAPIAHRPPLLVAEITASSATQVLVGAALGLFGALLAFGFVRTHKLLMRILRKQNLLDRPLPLALLGGAGICVIGLLVPHTLFWGEFELEIIAVAGETVENLPRLWPKGGATGFEIDGFFSAMLVGFAKLAAISITVAAGYRGGFIFPFFCAGAGFGRAITYIFPSIHPVVAVLTVGAGINATITRTALATPLILAALAGEPNSAPPILAASLAATFATVYLVRTIAVLTMDIIFMGLLMFLFFIRSRAAFHFISARSR